MLLYVWARQQPTCAPHLPVHERGGVAAVAGAAVEVLLPAAHPADAAVRAVVLPLAQVVLKEVAPAGRGASRAEGIGRADPDPGPSSWSQIQMYSSKTARRK